MSNYRYPRWARGRRLNPLTEVEQERIRLNAGRISVRHLARLMQRRYTTVRAYALSLGFGPLGRGPDRTTRQWSVKPPGRPPKRPVYTESEAQVARLVSLAALAGQAWQEREN